MKRLFVFALTMVVLLALTPSIASANFPQVKDFELRRSFDQPCEEFALTPQQMMHRGMTRTDNWWQKNNNPCFLGYFDEEVEWLITDQPNKDEVITDFAGGDYTPVAFGDNLFESTQGMQIRWFDSVKGWFVNGDPPCIEWKDIKSYIRSQGGPSYRTGKFTRPQATRGVFRYKGPGRRFVIPCGMATIDSHNVVRLAGYVMPKTVTEFTIFNRNNFGYLLLRRNPVMDPWSS